MSIFIPVDDVYMINRNLFFTDGNPVRPFGRTRRGLAACICSIGIISGIMAGCESEPVVYTPPPEPPPSASSVVPAEDDVWTLLAKGEGDKARPFFLGEVDINARDSLGRTALHIAAENEDSFLAAFFISLGAEVDALDREQRTPLAISTEKLDAPTARVLAASGADIHFPMKNNTSPARTAVRQNGEFLSAFLFPRGLSSIDASGRTILHIAAEAGSASAVDAILKVDNNYAQKDNLGKTALDIALERSDSRDHAETAEYLILAGAVSDNPLFGYFAPAVRTSNYNIRSADGMAPLHYIAREGYMGYLCYMVEKKADVNIKNASGATPLHEAARSGNVMLMETLLDNGAEINTQDAKGNSALHIAVPPATHLAAINLFLGRGANPNLRDVHGDSPLHIAIVLNRQTEIIRTLLAGGADVTIRDVDGKTPLYLAVEYNRGQYIPLLLSFRADIFAEDNGGISPFEKALRENAAMAFPLITAETVQQNDSAGNTLLHIAVSAGGSTAILKEIIARNAAINARNKAGDTSLTIAVRNDAQEAGELLLNHGANIFAANAAGESPLYLSFPPPGKSASELRQWMLTPQTLGARDGLGNTALHYAAQWRFDTWIPFLVELGAKTEAANATGETPLFTAVKYDSPSTIIVLIDNGALLSGRDTLGNSVLHAAVRWHAINAANTLIDLGLDVNCHALNGKTPLHDSIRLGMLDIEILLLKRGADIEIRDAEGNTPFMEAVFAGNPAIMEQLTSMGADPNTRNFRGDTPLHIVAAAERADLATLLLGWGASIHAKNSRGRTPFQNALATSPRLVRTLLTKDRLFASDDNGSSVLHIAIQERASLPIIKTILDLGARLSSVDSEGRTPLRLAVDMNLWDSAKLLADSGTDVYITARDGKSAAELSLVKGEAGIKALFSGKAIDSKDSSGNTILHYAARQGNTLMITQLLSLGASKGTKNIAAESPADIAMRWKHPDAAALLY